MSTPEDSRFEARASVRSLISNCRKLSVEYWPSFFVAVASSAFVFWGLGPSDIFTDSTPTGGDMGAHVWGPAFLRDHLLPSFQLRGWSPDWYAGFPAMQFYMVLPYLFIVLFDLLLPYGVAFKIVAISGVVLMPLAAWAMGRLSSWREPLPGLMAVAALLFVFDFNFTIYGGNIASTLAGEFAFSMGLAASLLYLGLVHRVLEHGTHRGRAAVVLAVVALCHPITFLFSITATVVYVAVRSLHGLARRIRPKSMVIVLLLATLALLGVFAATPRLLPRLLVAALLLLCLLLLEFVSSLRVLAVGVLGGALSAFWTVPFLLRRSYLNDMGWEKLDAVRENLFFPDRLGGDTARMTIGWLLALAALGGLVGLVRWFEPALMLSGIGFVAALGFIYWPQHRLWNARLLPFWYLTIYFLAAVGVLFLSESFRSTEVLSGKTWRQRTPKRWISLATPVLALVAATAFVSVYLGVSPGGSYEEDGDFRWGPFTVASADRNFVGGWAAWNFSGYESRPAFPTLNSLIETMVSVGQEYGCGRALWEYDRDELGSYGTPMAPMLLPYWTDGCIGSMEGLYFESSSTVPFHFLMQSELSANPSRPMRGLAYRGLDLDNGTRHLQMSGVRYYMAFSERALGEARRFPDRLELVARSDPWSVYRVLDADLVEGLAYEPNVSKDRLTGGRSWTDPSTEWFNDPTRWEVLVTSDGPSHWNRIDVLKNVSTSRSTFSSSLEQPLAAVSVTEIVDEGQRISFTVDQVGIPVVVKTSYFPNWSSKGALGPYHATPNWMIVVPTEHEVVLEYGATWVEYLGWIITVIGAGSLLAVTRGKRRKAPR